MRLHVHEEIGPLQGHSQFADKLGAGADMAVFCIWSVLFYRTGLTTFLLFVDIKGAYDITWKAALGLKLFAAGLQDRVWHLLNSILATYPAHLKIGGELSELLRITVGLAQGSPLSGFAFTAFLGYIIDLFGSEHV